MFKLTTLITNAIISLLAWRGIRCIEAQQDSMLRLPRLAAVHADSFVVVESLLLTVIVVATALTTGAHETPA